MRTWSCPIPSTVAFPRCILSYAGGAPLAQHIEDFMRVCSCAAFMQVSSCVQTCTDAAADCQASWKFQLGQFELHRCEHGCCAGALIQPQGYGLTETCAATFVSAPSQPVRWHNTGQGVGAGPALSGAA